MTRADERAERSEPVIALVFARAYVGVVGGALLLLVMTAVWLGLATTTPAARLVAGACGWALAVAASTVMLVRRRAPTGRLSAVAQAAALIGTAAVFGLAREASAGVLVAVPALAFLAVAVTATMLRADAPQ